MADASDWRPIETAPRDGTEIVAYLGGSSMANIEDPDNRFRVLRWSTHYSIFGLGGCWTDGLCTLGDRIDVTHWMPLPEPPETAPNPRRRTVTYAEPEGGR